MSFAARWARIASPVAWRSPLARARRFHGFAHAEASSMIDLRLAARGTDCPVRAAQYLRHADDEARHAVMFERCAARLRRDAERPPLPPVRADTEALFEALGEPGFLAFVHHGEARALAQFEVYRRWFEARGLGREAAVLAAIMPDERRHAAYTWDLLVALCGDERAASGAVRRARRWELWRRWRRAGRALTVPLYRVLAGVLYCLAAPSSLLIRVIRPVRTGFRPPGGA